MTAATMPVTGAARPRSLPLVGAVVRAQLVEIGRNRWVLAYAVVLALLTAALVQLTGSGTRALSGLLNAVLLLVPVVTTVFGVTYWHAAREFTELLLAQPVSRRALWTGLYAGLVLPLALAFALGLGLPILLLAADREVLPLLALYVGVGAALTAIFGALALWIGVASDDRLRALGLALGVVFVATVAYDAVVVWLTTAFSDWPLERPMLVAMLANPIDLARTAIMLRLDSAALMGYTGAVLARVLGGEGGLLLTAAGLGAWTIAPSALALRAFRRKDF